MATRGEDPRRNTQITARVLRNPTWTEPRDTPAQPQPQQRPPDYQIIVSELHIFVRWMRLAHRFKNMLDETHLFAIANSRTIHQVTPLDPGFKIQDILLLVKQAIKTAVYSIQQEFKQSVAEVFGYDRNTTSYISLPGEEKHVHNLFQEYVNEELRQRNNGCLRTMANSEVGGLLKLLGESLNFLVEPLKHVKRELERWGDSSEHYKKWMQLADSHIEDPHRKYHATITAPLSRFRNSILELAYSKHNEAVSGVYRGLAWKSRTLLRDVRFTAPPHILLGGDMERDLLILVQAQRETRRELHRQQEERWAWQRREQQLREERQRREQQRREQQQRQQQRRLQRQGLYESDNSEDEERAFRAAIRASQRDYYSRTR